MATKASAKKKKQPTAKKERASAPVPAPAQDHSLENKLLRLMRLHRPAIIRGACLGAVLIVALLVGIPFGEQFVEEGRASQVVGNARTFCRGAQLAAGEQMSSGETPEQAAEYLLTSQGFSDAQAAVQEQPAVEEELPVTEIVDVTLDSDGWITDFSCIVANGKDSYLVTLDLTSGDATAEKQPRVEEN